MTDLREELARAEMEHREIDFHTGECACGDTFSGDHAADSILRVLSEWVEANTEELVEAGEFAIERLDWPSAPPRLLARHALAAFSALLTSSGTGEPTP